jgi:hypothetical protein
MPAKVSPKMIDTLRTVHNAEVIEIVSPYDGTTIRKNAMNAADSVKLPEATIVALVARKLITKTVVPAGFRSVWRFVKYQYTVTPAGRAVLDANPVNR